MSILNAALGFIEFAPAIAKLLGGEKASEMAEKIVDSAQRVTGAGEIPDIHTLLKQNPSLLMQFQKDIETLATQSYGYFIADRQSARLRDNTFIQSGKRNFRGDVMVIAAVLGLIGCLVGLTFFKSALSGEAIGIISTIAGIFGSCLKDAYAFEFGSSRGSKEKETHLLDLLASTLNTFVK